MSSYVATLAVRLYERLNGRDQVHTARAKCNLGRILVELGRLEEAEALMQEARAVSEAKYKTKVHIEVGHVYMALGLLHRKAGRPQASATWYGEACKSYAGSYTAEQVPLERNTFLKNARAALAMATSPGLSIAARLEARTLEELQAQSPAREGPYPGQDKGLQLHIAPLARRQYVCRPC